METNSQKKTFSVEKRTLRHRHFVYPNQDLLFSVLHPDVYDRLKRDESAHERIMNEKEEKRRERMNRYLISDLTNDNLFGNKSSQGDRKEELKTERIHRMYSVINPITNILYQRTISLIEDRYDIDFPIDDQILENLKLSREVENGREISEDKLNFGFYTKNFTSKNIVSGRGLGGSEKANFAHRLRREKKKLRDARFSLADHRSYYMRGMPSGGRRPKPSVKMIPPPSEMDIQAMQNAFLSNISRIVQSDGEAVSAILSLNGAHITVERHVNPSLVGKSGTVIYTRFNGAYVALTPKEKDGARTVIYLPFVPEMKTRVSNLDLPKGKRHMFVFGNWMLNFWRRLVAKLKKKK